MVFGNGSLWDVFVRGVQCGYKEDIMKKAFLICPVRGKDPKETQHIVEDLESQNIKVHWPPRDTNQKDDTGYNICTENKEAIEDADIIYIVWDGESQGCLFDLGMAFAMNKKIIPLQLPHPSDGKSFQNMVAEWQKLV